MGIVAWVVLGLAAAILLLAFHLLTRGDMLAALAGAPLGAPVNRPGTLSRMAPARLATWPQPEWDTSMLISSPRLMTARRRSPAATIRPPLPRAGPGPR